MADNDVSVKTGTPVVSYQDSSPLPAGIIQAYAGTAIPDGWLPCDGRELDQVTYAQLYARIGNTYNTQVNPTATPAGSLWSAPAAGKFRIPDTRGLFLRAVGAPSGATAVTLGGYQADQNLTHTHPVVVDGTGGLQAVTARAGGAAFGSTTSNATTSSGGNEARPRNIGVNHIIKCFDATYVSIGTPITGSGGVAPVSKSGVFTALPNTNNRIDVTSAPGVMTLPATPLACTVKFVDAFGNCSPTNYISLFASGSDTIDGYNVGDEVRYDWPGAAAEVTKAAGETRWVIERQTTTSVPAASASPGTVSNETDSGWLTLPTVTWNGTTPTTPTILQYRWTRVGKNVTLTWHAIYTNVGASNSQATWVLPATVPAPATVTTGGHWSYVGSGHLAAGMSNLGLGQVIIDSNNGVHTIYTFANSAGAYRVARGSVTYITD